MVAVPIVRVGVGVGLTVLACQAGQQRSTGLDQTLVREVVEELAEVVAREYFDADLAAGIASSMTSALSEGRYANVETIESLAEALTEDLFAMSRDRHLGVTVVRDRVVLDQAGARPTGAADEGRLVGARRTNFGVQHVEILAGNVGYLNLTWFYRPEEARDAIAAAMRVLRSADALIVDMRDNRGGSPGTVSLLASYMFDSPDLPLFEIIPRDGSSAEFRTMALSSPDKNATRPMYVLTADRTFSAGEGFAYILQERHRAEVIGERTSGAANPGRSHVLTHIRNAGLLVTVPNGQVRTAVRGDNWEGHGVRPDIEASADEALGIAHVHALRELVARSSGLWQETLRQQLDALEASRS